MGVSVSSCTMSARLIEDRGRGDDSSGPALPAHPVWRAPPPFSEEACLGNDDSRTNGRVRRCPRTSALIRASYLPVPGRHPLKAPAWRRGAGPGARPGRACLPRTLTTAVDSGTRPWHGRNFLRPHGATQRPVRPSVCGITQAAEPVSRVVDTNGAGDGSMAVFMAPHLDGAGVATALRFGRSRRCGVWALFSSTRIWSP